MDLNRKANPIVGRLDRFFKIGEDELHFPVLVIFYLPMQITVETFNNVNADYCRRLPKIELHAHLTGSISPQTLHEIWLDRVKNASTDLGDPIETMSREIENLDVVTFFPLFDNYIYSLVNNEEAIRFSTTAVLKSFLADGVRYLELRTTPRAIQSANITKRDYVSLVLDCISNFVKDTKGKMSTYLILSIDRRNSPSEAMQTVDLAIDFQSRGVVGVDLCGNPFKGDVSIFKDAFTKAKSAELKITLHFAEVPASSSEDELKTLLSYQPQRLGHAVNVPIDIADIILERRLALELCLSCNVKAKLTKGGYEDHHFGFWLKQSCPVILCTDDVGVFGSSVSNEYLLAAKHFKLSRRDLFNLSMRSVDGIFSSSIEKTRIMDLLKDFEQEIL